VITTNYAIRPIAWKLLSDILEQTKLKNIILYYTVNNYSVLYHVVKLLHVGDILQNLKNY